jgi:magnesium transporter
MRVGRLLGPELETLLNESPGELRQLVEDIHPEDIADVIGELEAERASSLLRALPIDYAAQVFERLNEEQQAKLASFMGPLQTARIATEMDADDLVDFLGGLPTEEAAPLLEQLERVDPEIVVEVEELGRWPDASAGGLMTTNYLDVPAGATIAEAVEALRREAHEAETSLDTLYVLEGDRVIGFLTLRDLLLSRPEQRVDEVMSQNVISVPPELDQEEVARTLAKYDLNTLPVLDAEGRILGVITSDDVLDVMTEEQHEDVQKMGAIAPIEEGYFGARIGVYIKRRAPWLVILFVGGYFTTTAMEAFDPVLQAISQLAFYVPLLVSAGGNSGSQSSTLVIRGLAVGEIRAADWWRVLGRELIQGIVLGLLLALLGIGRVLVSGGGLDMALLVAVTIVSIVTMGCIVGGMMPLALHRLGVDPATSSTPFIATLVDVLGILIYLTLASWVFRDVLAASQ